MPHLAIIVVRLVHIWYVTQKTYIFPGNVRIGNPWIAAGQSAFVLAEINGYP